MRLNAELAGLGVYPVEQGAHDTRDQHPGFTGTGTGLYRDRAPRVAGYGIKGLRTDAAPIVFVRSLEGLGGGVCHAASQKSLRHRPRAAQKSQALPSPMAVMGAPRAMRAISLLMLSINWSRKSTISACT